MSPEIPLRDAAGTGIGLIETLRWEPGEGFVRLSLHLERLERSAMALGFAPPAGAMAALEAHAGGETGLRIRLELNRDGAVTVTAAPFVPLPEKTVWRLKIARSIRLSPADPLLRHKTTRREAYMAARAEYSPAEADEVVLLNERGEVCEGTITSIFVATADGTLLTPPLSSGLLAGVLRAELIARGRARVARLKPDDLSGAILYAGNSLRGLIRAGLS